ncbi:type II toxin-antitoxin system VapC family toxin [Sorangium sp. So ce131]|uniref:type II toxin-antitoxin system VapC family toxin n=1 Tax=Sorangium sp. So ce131 TaxID=3133282 RepID=UPI003F60ED7F
MRALLDTHAFLWWLDGDEQLSLPARAFISDDGNEIFVSAASAWEIATKARIGKLPGALDVAADIMDCLRRQGFTPLGISVSDGQRAGSLPGPHKDPFDRMLIAQALALDVPLITNERVFEQYGVRRLW